MRSTRVALSTLRRLDKVTAKLWDEDGQPRQGVLLLPRSLSLDDWEAEAVPMQAKLVRECARDAGQPVVVAPPVELPERKLSTSYSLATGQRWHQLD